MVLLNLRKIFAMVQIKQDEVKKVLLLYYRQQLQETLEEMFHFEQKYQMTFENFSSEFEQIENNEFEKEDDLIEWKAARGFAQTYNDYLKQIGDGFFEIVE